MDESSNAYEILGISDGLSATPDDIKKVYRKLAIVKHPDKNPNNPNAAAEFTQIDAAYRLLLDPAAKLALDDVLHARAARLARESQMSDKRKKMREDLGAREKKVVGERNEEELAKARLKVELERLRARAEKEAMDRSRAATVRQDAPSTSSQGLGVAFSSTKGDERMEILARTIKISWDPSAREWSSEQLKKGLESSGMIVENIFLSDKTKSKGKASSAKAVLGSRAHAALALKSRIGEGSSSLSITPVIKDVFSKGQKGSSTEGLGFIEERGEMAKRHKASPLFPSSSPSAHDRPLFPLRGAQATAQPPTFPSSNTFPSSFSKASSFPSSAGRGESGFEAQVLEKMRREAERKRALAEAEAEV